MNARRLWGRKWGRLELELLLWLWLRLWLRRFDWLRWSERSYALEWESWNLDLWLLRQFADLHLGLWDWS